MAKITWLGEDAAHQKEDGSGMGPSYCDIFGVHFEKGKAVTVKEPSIIERAARNRFFNVELTAAEAPEPADHAPDVPKRGPGRPPRVKPNVVDSNAA